MNPTEEQINKKIALSNSASCAVVDVEDYPILSRYTWKLQTNGYAVTTISHNKKYIQISMHRLIVGSMPIGAKREVDHINRDKLDNRKKNLRLVNRSYNQQNKGKTKNRSSVFLGVTWCRNSKKWKAATRNKGESINLGYFNREIKAAQAYDRAVVEYKGEHALTNIKLGSYDSYHE